MNNSKRKLKQRCYARSLNGCSDVMSQEHVLSDSITDDNFKIYFKDSLGKKIDTKAIKLRYLCSHHNSALSSIDTEAIRFFNALRYITNPEIKIQNNTQFSFSRSLDSYDCEINGVLLEKWFAKTFLNLATYFGLMKVFPNPVLDVNCSHILSYLFLDAELSSPYGLWQLKPSTYLLPSEQEAVMSVATREVSTKMNGEPEYSIPGLLYIQVFGIEFVGNFNITQFDNKTRDSYIVGEENNSFRYLNEATFRPTELIFSTKSYSSSILEQPEIPRKIVFSW